MPADRGQRVLGRLGLGRCAGLNRQELVTYPVGSFGADSKD